MRLTVFASGSTGNCALVRGGGRSVLVDAGISARRICTSLRAVGQDPGTLDGIFITHEHSDHVSGLPVLADCFPLPVFAPGAVADGLCRAFPELCPHVCKTAPEQPMRLGQLAVTAFPTPHDTPASFGYRFEADGAVLVMATDTGCVTDTMLRFFDGAGAALIEANYDELMLKTGPYPVFLKRRILSDRGHLSNAECTWLAAVLADRGVRQIILGHISKKNNLPDLARRTVARGLAEGAAELFTAPEAGCLDLEVKPCSM